MVLVTATHHSVQTEHKGAAQQMTKEVGQGGIGVILAILLLAGVGIIIAGICVDAETVESKGGIIAGGCILLFLPIACLVAGVCGCFEEKRSSKSTHHSVHTEHKGG